ncbi:alanine--glyoxylate aminotransferase family protein [Streptomyces sp. NPDC012461]|uniref:Alanine--glyoxylate aminotransferase family protein n=2 Tax=unclassified Streptomyces TaxID=2593676 RepID=A0A6G3R1G3_9ACTN|nr:MULTISPECIES: alanine--glyoxylate aminotransferase family protein [unclassified Streptomyces]NEA89432.1 alanine--glyoxylate aminotransferase family protein [Streptomyces sp. SID14436]NEC81654.1 alanine--glyoxylate aminotransferase family protein [Streptomyces sp. SID7958]
MKKYRLMVPGPTAAPPEVTAAGALPAIDERIPRFASQFDRVTGNLRAIFETDSDVLMLMSSTTGACESTIQNLFSPGERVLVANNGFFAERWAAMCRAFGLDVVELAFEWGESVDAARVADTLAADPSITGAVCVHCETSTGAVSDMDAFAEATRDVVSVVDAASSLGALPLRCADRGLDVVVSGCQKALMTPAGLSFVAISERAWQAHQAATMPRFYFDWTQIKTALAERGATPFTPATTLIGQLDVALDRILTEGLDEVCQRHATACTVARAGLAALGFDMLIPAGTGSVVTAARTPPGVDADKLVRTLLDEHGVQITGGVGRLAGRVIRLGHCGEVDAYDVITAISAVELAITAAGHQVQPGTGVSAAQRALAALEGAR